MAACGLPRHKGPNDRRAHPDVGKHSGNAEEKDGQECCTESGWNPACQCFQISLDREAITGGGSERASGREHLLDMARNLHLAPDPGDAAVPADQEGRALDPHVLPAVHRLLDPDAVALGRRRRPRRRAGSRRARACRGTCSGSSRCPSTHRRPPCRPRRSPRSRSVKSLASSGAARRVVLGVEIEHQLAPGEIGELGPSRRGPSSPGRLNAGSFASRFDAHRGTLPRRWSAASPSPAPIPRAAKGAAMRLDDFDYRPAARARRAAPGPAAPRLAAAGRRAEAMHDSTAGPPRRLAGPGDLLVFNDTRVIPARLHGFRRRAGGAGGAIEATLIAPAGDGLWRALARPGKRLAVGDRIGFGDALSAEVRGKDGAEVLLAFDRAGPALEPGDRGGRRDAAAPYIAAPPPRRRSATATTTRRSSPPVRAPSPRRPRRCTSTRRCSPTLAARGVARPA